jgi:SAM-dependent methyltransferase
MSASNLRPICGQLRDYSPDDPLTNGVERGGLLLHALEHTLGISANGRVLADIGCGYGGVSLAWAERGGRAIAIDKGRANLSILRTRIATKTLRRRVTPLQTSALQLPLESSSADIALMSGVLEWIGYTSEQAPVGQLQSTALREAFRILKPGGTLVIGTKNRLFPRYSWRDGQVGLPLLNALPRRAADWLCRRLRPHGYRAHIYSYWGWKRLLARAGITNSTIWIPLFTYQYPLALVEPWRRNRVRQLIDSTPALSAAASRDALAPRGRAAALARRAYYSTLGEAGLLGLGAGSFLLACRKEC